MVNNIFLFRIQKFAIYNSLTISIFSSPARPSVCEPLPQCSRRQQAYFHSPEPNFSTFPWSDSLTLSNRANYLDGTLEVVASLPCVEMRFSIVSCFNGRLVALVGPEGGEGGGGRGSLTCPGSLCAPSSPWDTLDLAGPTAGKEVARGGKLVADFAPF